MDINAPHLKVVNAGLLSTIQDSGRFGFRHLGIPWAGTLCPAWRIIGNSLVGNDSGCAVIECFEGGLQLQAGDTAVRVAVIGSPSAHIKLGNQIDQVSCKANRSLTIAPGASLYLSSTGSLRHAIIAIANIDIPEHLGSTSTYAKASLGGLDGSALQAGDNLRLGERSQNSIDSEPHTYCELSEELLYQSNVLRAIPGPQFDHFSSKGVDTFMSSSYELSTEADRMGVRLSGPVVAHRDASAKDIVSDAIVPGSVQVPGTGLPIVLLNDAHTAGGYPKIATVISTDLPILGARRAGAHLRFKLVDIDEAIAARVHQRNLIDRAVASIAPCIVSEISLSTLFENNLIDGVTNGHDELNVS